MLSACRLNRHPRLHTCGGLAVTLAVMLLSPAAIQGQSRNRPAAAHTCMLLPCRWWWCSQVKACSPGPLLLLLGARLSLDRGWWVRTHLGCLQHLCHASSNLCFLTLVVHPPQMRRCRMPWRSVQQRRASPARKTAKRSRPRQAHRGRRLNVAEEPGCKARGRAASNGPGCNRTALHVTCSYAPVAIAKMGDNNSINKTNHWDANGESALGSPPGARMPEEPAGVRASLPAAQRAPLPFLCPCCCHRHTQHLPQTWGLTCCRRPAPPRGTPQKWPAHPQSPSRSHSVAAGSAASPAPPPTAAAYCAFRLRR